MRLEELAPEVRRFGQLGIGRSPRWSRAETVLAFLLLVYLDPSKLGGSKPRKDGTVDQERGVLLLARLLGRTEDAVVMKVMNLRRSLTGGERGLRNQSRLDPEIVSHFSGRYDELLELVLGMATIEPRINSILDATGAIPALTRADHVAEGPALVEEPVTSRKALVNARRGQGLFSSRVLANYACKCAICGIHATRESLHGIFLRAGHIRPWKDATAHSRLDPNNGLSLCVTHDRAFEHGIITLDERLKVTVSKRTAKYFGPERFTAHDLFAYEGQLLQRRAVAWVAPGEDYLDFHRRNVFDSYAER